MNIIPAPSGKVTISPTGMQFHDELTFDEWREVGDAVIPAAKAIGFVVGDWLNYGAARYGEKYDEAIQSTGMSYSTLSGCSYVARNVKPCCRQQNLGFEHHAVVAKIKDEDKQREWLVLAAREGLSVARLRRSVNLGRVASDDEMQGDSSDRGYVTYLALLNRLRRWWKRETEKAPVEQWDQERRQVLKEDFAFVRDIYDAL